MKTIITTTTTNSALDYLAKNFIKVTVRCSKPKRTVSNSLLAEEVEHLKGAGSKLAKITIDLRADDSGRLREVDTIIDEANAYAPSVLKPLSVKRVQSSKEGVLHVDDVNDFIGRMAGYEARRQAKRAELEPIYSELARQSVANLAGLVQGMDTARLFPSFDEWFGASSIEYDFDTLEMGDLTGVMAKAFNRGGEELLEQRAKQFENLTKNVLEQALNSINRTLHVCTENPDGKRRRVSESLFESLKDDVKSLRRFNIYSDPSVDVLASKLERLLTYDIKDVRNNDATRAQLGHDAKAALKHVQIMDPLTGAGTGGTATEAVAGGLGGTPSAAVTPQPQPQPELQERLPQQPTIDFDWS